MSDKNTPTNPITGGQTPASDPSAQGSCENKTAAGHNGAAAQPKKSGSGLALLALLFGASGIGIGGYTYTLLQNQQARSDETAKQAELAAQSVAQAAQTIDALKTTQGLDKSQVEQMIAAAVAEVEQKEAHPAAPSEAQINDMITDRLAALPKPQPTLSADDIKAMIATAVADSVQEGSKIDLSEQIDTFTASREKAQQALEQLNQRAQTLEQSLTEKTQSLMQSLQAQTADTVNPQPLINLLNLAAVAADSGNYTSAARYLTQALNSYATFNLNQPPYIGFKGDIEAAQQRCAALAKSDLGTITLNKLAQSVASWPLKSGNAFNEVEKNAPEAPVTLADKAQHFGAKVLGKAFTITKNDEAGLTWINANPILQEVIRENVRLDLAYARNAALMHDLPEMKAALESVIPQIQRYFDTDAAPVIHALDVLQNLPGDVPEVPNIQQISDALAKASGVQS